MRAQDRIVVEVSNAGLLFSAVAAAPAGAGFFFITFATLPMAPGTPC